jgi:hypothetical protein
VLFGAFLKKVKLEKRNNNKKKEKKEKTNSPLRHHNCGVAKSHTNKIISTVMRKTYTITREKQSFHSVTTIVALRKVQHKYYNKVQKLSTSSTNM